MSNIKPWLERAPIWAAKDPSPQTKREEAMLAELRDAHEALARASTDQLPQEVCEALRQAVSLISGQFENDVMPPSVQKVVATLSDLAAVNDEPGTDVEVGKTIGNDDGEKRAETGMDAGVEISKIIGNQGGCAKEGEGLNPLVIRSILIRHLGWLGAMGWHDDIAAITHDILSAARVALPSAALIADLYTGLHAILGGSEDTFIVNESSKLIDQIDALRDSGKIITEMALCASTRLGLRPDQPYVFRVHAGCPDCDKLAEPYKDN